MLDKKTLLIFTVILLSTAVIIGSMFTLAERFDRRYELESRIAELKGGKREAGGSPGPGAEDDTT